VERHDVEVVWVRRPRVRPVEIGDAQAPESGNLDEDARVLAVKQDAGASFAVTQLFFRASDYFRLVERAAEHGCSMPIIPGIMPVTNVAQIERFAQISGAEFPVSLAARFHEVADDPQAVHDLGVEVATELCSELLDGGAPGLHFYTLNRSTSTVEIHAALGFEAMSGAGGSATPDAG